MMIFLLILFLLICFIYIFLQQPRFGRLPSGERLQRIQGSPNYKDGQFQNMRATPAFAEGATYAGVLKEFFFGKSKRNTPKERLPSQQTNLKALKRGDDVLVWFGHSSYFMQLDGKRILVDPVLSGSASPIAFTTRSFNGSDVYTTDDLPEIDYLFISHDHYDHLDYQTITKLRVKVKKVITGLGVGAHFERWGYDSSSVIEKDWNEKIILDEGFTVHTAPARHFSGRAFKRNTSLWLSFVLATPTQKIFIGGDSGYDTHFKTIGEQHGPFDLAILENGQYNWAW
ncbi:MAG TPA: MBL fold metallo-hydrolase, partial [Flavisolibacter sp.]|nr:MBL fold metallo-hydrolase [Flavisolibacter sp.]